MTTPTSDGNKKAAGGKSTVVSDFETALGFRELEVEYREAKTFHPDDLKRIGELSELCGKKEAVQIYQTRAKDIPAYHHLYCGNDMEAFAEFLCRKPAGWGELLTADSIIALTDPETGVGPQVNHPLWLPWFRGVTKRNIELTPGSDDFVERFMDILRKKNGESQSDASSSRLPSD